MDFRFEPVLSVAPGRVIRAGWYNPLNHNSSFGLWVAVDHGNGIVTSYGHLSSVLVAVGDRMERNGKLAPVVQQEILRGHTYICQLSTYQTGR